MPCIYTLPAGLCDGKAPLSQREHYLPRGLGNFLNDIRLVNKICDACQNKCSRLEDVFMHNSPEAFFREMVGQLGRRGHRKKNIFYEPTWGIEPLTIIGKAPDADYEILWERVNENQCIPLKQIIVIFKNGESLPIPFRAGKLTPDKIRELMAEKGNPELKAIVYSANNPEETAEMEALSEQLAPRGKSENVPLFKEGSEIDGQMKAFISPMYARAIAKIAFHFFLAYFPQFSGLESEFEDIKRYIYNGVANRLPVRTVPEQFVFEFQRGGRMKTWAHFLTAECGPQGVEARMQFFAGPQVQPLVWSVLIGKNPSRLVYRQNEGYAFVYFDAERDGYHGERKPLTANERILLPRR